MQAGRAKLELKGRYARPKAWFGQQTARSIMLDVPSSNHASYRSV